MKNPNTHVDVYEGPYDYLFVSYAHADAARVMPIIKRLSDDGVRIWYDDGIEIGSSWDDTIAYHLSHAKGVILFFSNNFFNSSNCKDEANYARDLGKDQIIIQLEDTTIPPGMEMRFNRIQSVSVTSDTELMYKKIYASSVLKNCRRIGTEEAEQAEKPASQKRSPNTKWIAIIAIACVVLAGIVLAIILVLHKPSTDQAENVTEKPNTETAQSTETASKEQETSKDTNGSSETKEAGDASAETISYTLGTPVDIYEANTDNVQYTITVDEVHVMPEEFESNTWEEYDKDVYDLLSVKCSIENYGISKSEEGKLSLYSLLHGSTVLVKDPDDFLLRIVEVMYHGSDGSYDVQTGSSIPAGSKGRFALLYYVEEGTPSVTISIDDHHGTIARSEPINLEW